MLSQGGDFMKNDKCIKYFCENIKALRKRNKLSKRKMSKKLGISRRWLSSLEKGKIPTELTVDILISMPYGSETNQFWNGQKPCLWR